MYKKEIFNFTKLYRLNPCTATNTYKQITNYNKHHAYRIDMTKELNKQRAIEIARELFPCNLYGRNYRSYEELSRKDPIVRIDLLDHIIWNEPLNPGSIKEFEK